jgi:putative phosphoesterase
MRIVAFTDVHGSYNTIKEILRKESSFDTVVVGGDLTTHGTAGEAGAVIRTLQESGKPVFAVAGNMDHPGFDVTYESLGVNINGRGFVVNDVGFFGVAGSPFTPMNTPYEISEEEIALRAEAGWLQVESARWKVFVPHAPPKGTPLDKIALGRHVGSTSVRTFVERRQPDVLICGHIHESRGTAVLGTTQMVNCGTAARGLYAVVEISEGISIQLCG